MIITSDLAFPQVKNSTYLAECQYVFARIFIFLLFRIAILQALRYNANSKGVINTKNIIRDRRLELGLTMKEVADAVGVTEATVSRWESGDIANMKRSRIFNLAKALQLSPLDILGLPEEESQPTVSDGLSDAERTLLNAFRLLSPERQAFVIEQLQALSQLQ